MADRLAIPAPDGRAISKGVNWRALRFWLLIGMMALGGAMMAKALYIPVKAQVAQILLARAFDESLASGVAVKPWSWADTAPLARISAPRLNVSEIVLSGGSGEAMAFGPSAVVDDRAARVTILAAHRDTHFEFVQHLLIGDDIWVERIDGTAAHYRVARTEVTAWNEFTHPADGGEGLIALTTCYPFGSLKPGPLRYIVWAQRAA